MKKISKVLEKRGYFRTLEGTFVCYISQTIINNLFGIKKIFVTSYKNGNLKIKTNNYLASEIRLRQKEVIAEINQKLNNRKIKKIKF